MQALFTHFGYAAVFLALAIAGVGVPIPEELTQLTAGALAHEGILRFTLVVPVIWAGILVGDAGIFLLARRHGPWLLSTWPARRVLSPARRVQIERHYGRHAFWTVAVARHAGGIRFAAFILAAVNGVRLRTFLLADGLSALVSVPIVTGLGYVLWEHLIEARHGLRLVQIAVLAGVAATIAVVVIRRRRSLRRQAAAAGVTAPSAGPGTPAPAALEGSPPRARAHESRA